MCFASTLLHCVFYFAGGVGEDRRTTFIFSPSSSPSLLSFPFVASTILNVGVCNSKQTLPVPSLNAVCVFLKFWLELSKNNILVDVYPSLQYHTRRLRYNADCKASRVGWIVCAGLSYTQLRPLPTKMSHLNKSNLPTFGRYFSKPFLYDSFKCCYSACLNYFILQLAHTPTTHPLCGKSYPSDS